MSTSIVATPATVADRMNNQAFLQGALTQLQTSGLTDTGIIAAFQTAIDAIDTAAAADILADAKSKNITSPRFVTFAGGNYAVDNTTTPPSLVADVAVDAASIPVAGSATPPVVPPVTPPVTPPTT